MKRFIPLALVAAGLTVWLGLRGESGDRAKAHNIRTRRAHQCFQRCGQIAAGQTNTRYPESLARILETRAWSLPVFARPLPCNASRRPATFEIGVLQTSPGEICVDQVGSAQIGCAERRCPQIGAPQVGAVQIQSLIRMLVAPSGYGSHTSTNHGQMICHSHGIVSHKRG